MPPGPWETNMTTSTASSAPAAIALGLALAIAPTLALAEAQVRGRPNAVSVEAKDGSVEEILVALTKAFDVHFRSSANLEKRLTGTYEGSLQQVVAHILSGYDFIVKSGKTGLEITLLGPEKAVLVAAAPSASRTSERQAPSTAVPSHAADVAEGPVPAAGSGGGPELTTKPAEGPFPMPSVSGSPGPVPVPARGASPFPTPQAPGSTPPSPEPGLARPSAGTTPSTPTPAR